MKNSFARRSRTALNVCNMRRIPLHETVSIKIGDIDPKSLEGVEFDPIFHELYCKSLLGECSTAYTRISMAKIAPGFLRHDSEGGLQHFRDPMNAKVIRHFVNRIRAGERPALLLYRNRFPAQSQVEFLCADDASVYEAYRLLGIEKAPVEVLDPIESDFEESAIYTLYCTVPHDSINYIHHVHAADFDSVESVLGSSPPVSFDTAAKMLIEAIEEASERLRLFHLSGTVDLHYHHTLSSVLCRLKQAILGIQLLVQAGLNYQALGLLRTMYELALSFYVDWLAPEIIGPWLQISAVVSKRELREERQAFYEDKKADGWTASAISTLQKADDRAYDLVSKVIEKARINPLSQKHKDLYKHLSRIVHQDFTMAAKYAHTLEDGIDVQDDENSLGNLVTFADVLTAQVVARIVSDTGNLG